jgi:hypothetical protein
MKGRTGVRKRGIRFELSGESEEGRVRRGE